MLIVAYSGNLWFSQHFSKSPFNCIMHKNFYVLRVWLVGCPKQTNKQAELALSLLSSTFKIIFFGIVSLNNEWIEIWGTLAIPVSIWRVNFFKYKYNLGIFIWYEILLDSGLRYTHHSDSPQILAFSSVN